MNALLESDCIKTSDTNSLADAVDAACRRIPPLWSLKNFVAVNPFVGLTDRHFIDAGMLIDKVGHGKTLMRAEFFRQQIAAGKIHEHDVQDALAIARQSLPSEWAQAIAVDCLEDLKAELARSTSTSVDRVLTFADFLDSRKKTSWAASIVDEISKWCSAYFDQGQSSWQMPWRDLDLFAAWESAAQLDANPELMGLENFRAFVAALPDDPYEVVERTLRDLGIDEMLRTDFLHRQLMSLRGWSSYIQHRVRANNMAGTPDDSLAQLLAIRSAFDLRLYQKFGSEGVLSTQWQQHLATLRESNTEISVDLLVRFVAQQALECSYQNDLIAKLKKNPPPHNVPGQKSLQAVFCIDVRSEVLRRSLEAQSDEIETIGFAGFFGAAIEYLRFGQSQGEALCPVLLTPKFKVREVPCNEGAQTELLNRMNFLQTVNGTWNAFKTSAISCFSFVETAGLWFGLKLVKDSLALRPSESSFSPRGSLQFVPKIGQECCRPGKQSRGHTTGMALTDQIALAPGALKNMGLISDFAKVVLFCGHGSATTNNPYGSALDCGACGGHAGDVNARVMAAILNDAAVREGLKSYGIEIPAATLFIPALHNTTTDEVLIYEDQAVSHEQSEELDKIKGWISLASKQARRERADSLGLGEVGDDELDTQLSRRSRDWSQVRPEWGLAGNASFIAAPRERTKGLPLGGRAFLHNYHAHLDADKSTLELILIAPMVVASWINLQYYGSTVDNPLFGSGNKVLHNVVGALGVWQGNGGDLQPGLPLQSIHDGERLMHEPLRLSVFVEAARSDIARILAKHSDVRHLVENGWVNLFAMENGGKEIYRFIGNAFTEESL